MKIVYPDSITAISTTTEHPAFVRSSMQSDYIGDKWKATTNSDTIVLTVSAGQVVAVFGTNATSIAIYKGAVLPGNLLTTNFDTTYGMAWAEHTYDAAPYTINIVASCGAGTFLEVGKVVAGPMLTFPDPRYGMPEGFKDMSVIKELPSGGYYTKKRNIVRTFDMQIEVQRDTVFYQFMRDFYRANGPKPVAWRLTSTLTNTDWIVFATIPEPPSGSHDYFSHSVISIKLVENI